MSEESRSLLPAREKGEEDVGAAWRPVVSNGRQGRRDPVYYSEDPLHVPFLVRLLLPLPLFRYVPKIITFKVLIWVLTFIAYTTYHMTRKTFSVVKVVLKKEWPPFNHHNANTLLGGVDNAWGFSYAIAMFFSGAIADRVNLRYFLTFGMLGSAIATMLLGVPYYAGIHWYAYFIGVQIFGGAMQSTGWPSVVSLMSHWFGKQRRGLWMGLWNAHTSVGNILGTVIPSFWANLTASDPAPTWGLSFIVPSLIMAGAAMLIFSFLVIDPQHIGLSPPVHHEEETTERDNEDEEEESTQTTNRYSSMKDEEASVATMNSRDTCGISPVNESDNKILLLSEAPTATPRAVGFLRALMIPGVVEYSLALFFIKLVSYTFLFWLPYYVKESHPGLNSEKADWLSTFFDVGGIIGSITAGILSDILDARAFTCIISLILAVPSLFFLQNLGDDHISVFIVLLIVSGVFINGPYGLITTAVSSDLGTHKSLKNDQNAKATVTAIIDGTGSIGAALGPLLVGWITTSLSWKAAFYVLMISCFLSALFMMRLLVMDVLRFIKQQRHHRRQCMESFPISCRTTLN